MDFLFQNIIKKQEHVLEDNLDNKQKQQIFTVLLKIKKSNALQQNK
jgi:hypothetical protein